jgi:hypothetical protein
VTPDQGAGRPGRHDWGRGITWGGTGRAIEGHATGRPHGRCRGPEHRHDPHYDVRP